MNKILSICLGNKVSFVGLLNVIVPSLVGSKSYGIFPGFKFHLSSLPG